MGGYVHGRRRRSCARRAPQPADRSGSGRGRRRALLGTELQQRARRGPPGPIGRRDESSSSASRLDRRTGRVRRGAAGRAASLGEWRGDRSSAARVRRCGGSSMSPRGSTAPTVDGLEAALDGGLVSDAWVTPGRSGRPRRAPCRRHLDRRPGAGPSLADMLDGPRRRDRADRGGGRRAAIDPGAAERRGGRGWGPRPRPRSPTGPSGSARRSVVAPHDRRRCSGRPPRNGAAWPASPSSTRPSPRSTPASPGSIGDLEALDVSEAAVRADLAPLPRGTTVSEAVRAVDDAIVRQAEADDRLAISRRALSSRRRRRARMPSHAHHARGPPPAPDRRGCARPRWSSD